jgi:hypothetical protein
MDASGLLRPPGVLDLPLRVDGVFNNDNNQPVAMCRFSLFFLV